MDRWLSSIRYSKPACLAMFATKSGSSSSRRNLCPPANSTCISPHCSRSARQTRAKSAAAGSRYNDKGVTHLSIRSFFRLSAHIQMLPVLESGEETLVGGQAVMEGVMMRAPHSYCVAVRKPNGEIVTEQSPLPRVSEKYPIFKLPILRGLGTLGHAMYLGVKALQFSANVAIGEAAGENAPGQKARDQKPPEMTGWMMALPLAFSLLFFLFMYKFVPLFLATQLGKA